MAWRYRHAMRRHHGSRRLLAVLGAGFALIAGCGDDGGGTTSPPASTTVEVEQPRPADPDPDPTFAAAADQLCSAAMAEQERLRRELGGRQLTLGDRARLLVELAPSRIELGEQLAELEPPPAQAAAARALVRTAVRRGEASAEAGRLWEQNGSRAGIAAAAAAEHDARERFVEIARDLDLLACAEVMSPGQRKSAERAAIAAFSSDPEARCEVFGRRLAEQEYGGLGACPGGEPLAPAAAPADVQVESVVGMDGVFALVRVATPSGDYRVRLTFERGDYRVDKVD